MVGLYHKRRAQRSHSKVLGFLTKALMTLGLMVVIGFVLIVLFFNGSQIKKPLSTYLSAKTGFEVMIGDAEFSPLYPDVIKLYDVSFGSSKLGELYLEYDLRSALSEERLEINDLYLNGVTITPEDLQALTANRLGYHSIYATLVRFHHTPVKTQFLHTKDATIRLNNVGFNPEEGLTFRSGAIAAPEAELLESPVKDLSLQFAHDQAGLNIENFTAAMLGGMVSGQGRYLPQASASSSGNNTGFSSAEGFSQSGNADLIFDELNLSKVILHELGRPQVGLNLSARTVNLSEVIYTNDQQALSAPNKQDRTNQAAPKAGSHSDYHSMVMQGISGKLHDLELGHEHFSARFDGTIDALSFPNLQTSFEHNKGTAKLQDDQITFDFNGNLYEGSYSLKGTLDREHQELSLDEIKLEKSKLALNPPRLDFLQHDNTYTIKLTQGSFENLEFLSFLNQLPLSIQSISGSATNLQWGPGTPSEMTAAAQPESTAGTKPETTADSQSKTTAGTQPELATKTEQTAQTELTPATLLGQLKTSDHGELKLNLHNLLCSNLLFSDIELEAALTPKQLQVNLPQVKFQEASLSASGTLSLSDTGMSTFALEASDFESADLNSNLIGHMLTGKVNLNAQLTSSFTNWQDLGLKDALLQNLSGRIHLDSAGLLISDFGLDLINGGKQHDYTLSGTELLAALQGSVAGINTLEANTTFQAGKLSTQGRIGLATANASFSVNIDLLNHDFSGNAFMVSTARDSTTTVSFGGTTAEPSFAIRALSRGAQRPGLYLPQYDATAQAKEQTDAKGVLNGTVEVADASSAVAQSAAESDAPEQVSDAPINDATTTPDQPEAAPSDEQASPGAEPAETKDGTAAAEANAAEVAQGAEPAAESNASTATEPKADEATAPAENAAETSAAETDSAEVAQDAEPAAETTASTDAEPKADEATAEDAAEISAAETNATEVAQDAEPAAESSASTDTESKADETTAPAEDATETAAAESDATEVAQGTEPAAESSASTDAEPKADEYAAPAENAAETAASEAAQGAESAAETSASTDAEPKADEATAPAEDTAETAAAESDAVETDQGTESAAAESSASTEAEPKAAETTAPSEDTTKTSASEVAQGAEPAAESSASTDAEPKADEATAPAEDATETAATETDAAEVTQDAEPTAESSASTDTEQKADEATAPAEDATETAAAETDTTEVAQGAEPAAESSASTDAEPKADEATGADAAETTAAESDAAEVAQSAEPTAESSATAEPSADTAATGTDAAASAGATAQAPEELPDAAAQAQADQTEFELLKDVFIDSFIQHEHGTAAEEEAARAAAQKDAAARKAAEEKPYNPEEEMIF